MKSIMSREDLKARSIKKRSFMFNIKTFFSFLECVGTVMLMIIEIREHSVADLEK